jgi:hypothetical protein
MPRDDVTLTKEALTLLTPEQKDKLVALFKAGHIEQIAVMAGSFDLPEGYVTVWMTYNTGNKIFGGISPEGELST